MAVSTQLTLDLASLVTYIGTNQTSNVSQLALYYTTKEIVWSAPPQRELGTSTITAIWIDKVKYSDVISWTAAWKRASAKNAQQGIKISEGRPPSVTAVNIATATGTRLTTVAVTTATTTVAAVQTTQQTVTTVPNTIIVGPQGTRGDTGVKGDKGDTGTTGNQGLQGLTGLTGVGISGLAVNAQGNLIATLDNTTTVNAGYVVGPAVSLAVGTVAAGAAPSVTLTGGPINYALNFVLQAGPAGPGSGDVSTLSLYADPSWITSLAASKVGLGNVTNESKATMFASPTFTGTVSGVSATHVGLGNVTNESKTTMFASPTFTGTVSGAIPSGVITMWYGSIISIPSGWVLCDGTNSTPDLRNRFIIGAHSDDSGTAKTTVTGSATQTGGSKDAVLVSHSHTATVTDTGHTHANANGGTSLIGPNGTFGGVNSAEEGAGQPNNFVGAMVNQLTGITVANSTEGSSATNANLPPYYALAYIMKT